MASDYPFEQWNGITFPGLYALMARAHMHKYGTTERQMAKVAVKNHYHGSLNPKAHMQKEITIEKVLSSIPISSPLKLYDCSLISDGASCVILAKPEIAKTLTDIPVHIIGSGQASDTIGLYERNSLTSLLSTKIASKTAYDMAGVSSKDIDLAEVHDCFTFAELMAYEDLNFCEIGSKGHPVGATGTAQAYEMYLQLTDQAEKRQVNHAKIGLTHNVGGSGSTATIHVYRRD